LWRAAQTPQIARTPRALFAGLALLPAELSGCVTKKPGAVSRPGLGAILDRARIIGDSRNVVNYKSAVFANSLPQLQNITTRWTE
jgi:hypothetical protein